jgi:hypothetical protein
VRSHSNQRRTRRDRGLLCAFVRRVVALRAPARDRELERDEPERDERERDELERDELERDEALRADIGRALRVAFLRLFFAERFFGDLAPARMLPSPTATAFFLRVTFLVLRPRSGLCARFVFLDAPLLYFRP